MDQTLEVLIVIANIISIFVFGYKGRKRHDWSLISAIFPRIYLIGAVIYDLFYNIANPIPIHIGIFAVFLGDIIANVAYMLSPKFKAELWAAKLINILRDLEVKYRFLVEHTPVGIFVLNNAARFEFVNKSLCMILEANQDQMLARSLYDFISPEMQPRVKQSIAFMFSRLDSEIDYKTDFVTLTGIKKKIRINAKRTENGHPTITGTVTLLED